MKHVKGPWLIPEDDKSFVYALGDSGVNRFWLSVQATGKHTKQKEEVEATAKLIAAAPDLLEALEDLVRDIADPLDAATSEHFVTKAQAVIAKAKS